MTRIVIRPYSTTAALQLEQAGIPPTLARIYAARGIRQSEELASELPQLLPPDTLKGITASAHYLADALLARKKLLIIADYDCDGATACAVAWRGLRMLGAACGGIQLDYLVPNRFEYGYGLTPEIVELAARHPRMGKPDVLLTVDNGIASVEGVATAQALQMAVVITDHHLPGDHLPAADCIVNPNQPGCPFPSKNLAGVGVMFYVLLALRAELRTRGLFTAANQPRLDSLLDLVALGTVADVVRLDTNNRILVAQGLKRMRQGRLHAGVAALFRVAGRDASRACGFDLGFALGPRLNAAGRLADMSLGIECLITDDAERAWQLAQELDGMNRERREIEAGMQIEAMQDLESFNPQCRTTICVVNPTWHQGVIGIVASRLKEKFHRPTLTFAPADDPDLIKGSGRSIPGFHLRDALDRVAKQHPGLLLKFGGHAMAAGLTLRAIDFERFTDAFEQVGKDWLNEEQLSRIVETDGPLGPADCTAQFVSQIDSLVWGQGFPPPLFSGEFSVLHQSLVKERHLKLLLSRPDSNQKLQAIWFHHTAPLGEQVQVAYRLAVDHFNGQGRVQMIVEHALTLP